MSTDQISRVPRSKQKARLSYNRMSRWYDLLSGSSEKKLMNYGVAQLRPQPGEKILEIGCGTGHGLISLVNSEANSGTHSGIIIGLDISEGMLSQSKVLIRRSNLQNSIQLHLGDGCHLPYVSNYFSAVFLSYTLELFDTPDIPLVLAECRRVLKQRGRVVIVCLNKQESFPVNIYEWFHKYMPSFVDCRPIYVQPYLLQASFTITNISTKKMWGLPVEIVAAEIR
jgi:demethylmenaquinone methyltransferase/2-methoxy-6-polyprenyl-1,4-benzoquinol methylase